MSKVKDLESQIKGLSAEELAAFQQCFATFDAEVCDRQFEANVAAEKLNGEAARALQDHAAGRSTLL
jgi:hypothetical protein